MLQPHRHRLRCMRRLRSTGKRHGILEAHWGYGALHDGERYEVHLCESCFFATIAYPKQERRVTKIFEEARQQSGEDFGLVAKENFFRDGC